MSYENTYRGRFAPSPTGPLHFGSLFAAVVSYLDAKAHNGVWLLRIEDIDPPREQAGAADAIIDCLIAHQLHWDGDIRYQSQQGDRYEQVLDKLLASAAIFPCYCSRKELALNGEHSSTCRSGEATGAYALKFKALHQALSWEDLICGPQSTELDDDFVVKRRDQLYAYQLAVVSDDNDQGITHVIRGADLKDSTPMQLALYQALEIQPPLFGHFPLALNHDGQKLSKQNLSPPVELHRAKDNLFEILSILGIPGLSHNMPCQALLTHAARQWNYGHARLASDFISPI